MNNGKLLIIGSTGQLGTDMCIQARNAGGYDVVGIDFPAIDIADRKSVNTVVEAHKPGCIINCAAFTAVDACETEPEKAFSLNAEGPGHLAAAASRIGARMVHISTDYVFDGRKEGFYLETDPTDPPSVYGKSKLEGERLVAASCSDHQIFRIAWLYGTHGNNFVYTIRSVAQKQAAAGKPLKVVNDQVGTPTSTVEVCRQVLRAQELSETGVFHATCKGSCSWYDFAGEIISSAGVSVELMPCATDEFPRPAPRPRNSRLENHRLKKAGADRMADWRDAFAAFLEEEQRQKER